MDILVQSRRDKKAAKKFFRKLLKRLRYVPRVIITDKLRTIRLVGFVKRCRAIVKRISANVVISRLSFAKTSESQEIR